MRIDSVVKNEVANTLYLHSWVNYYTFCNNYKKNYFYYFFEHLISLQMKHKKEFLMAVENLFYFLHLQVSIKSFSEFRIKKSYFFSSRLHCAQPFFSRIYRKYKVYIKYVTHN